MIRDAEPGILPKKELSHYKSQWGDVARPAGIVFLASTNAALVSSDIELP